MTKNKTNSAPLALTLMQWLFKILTPFLPGVMGRYAYKIWFTPAKTSMPPQEQKAAEKAKVSNIVVDGLNVRVWSWGEGPTVLFIHGWGGRGTQISSFIETLNRAGFRVVSFDMPAHGQSQGNRTNAFSIAKTINEVIKHIDNLHSVITHSFGGVIFGYLYQPQLILKNCVLICPPATVHTALDQFCDTLQLSSSIKHDIENQLKKDFGAQVFDKLSLMINATKITQPTLIIHDKADDVVPFEDGKTVANVLPQPTFFETNGLGHRKILFDKNVVERIVKFIAMQS